MALGSVFHKEDSGRLAQPARPRLDLSGPILNQALEGLIEGTEEQGGIERWIDALKLKSRMFEQAFSDPQTGIPLETFKSLCAFMASVRRRVGAHLEEPGWSTLKAAMEELLEGVQDTASTDRRMTRFQQQFPDDRAHRWVRDLAAELLHQVDPERYPLMCRWVWDAKANTGVIREIWFDDEIDNLTLQIPDGYETYLVLREELSQLLSNNGVFRDVIWYVDLLTAKIYADYIAAQGGMYLRADFSAPGDPMEHTRRLLGLDGVRARSGKTRLKAINGEAFVMTEHDPEDNETPDADS